MKKIVALILAAQFALLAPYSYSQSAIHSGAHSVGHAHGSAPESGALTVTDAYIRTMPPGRTVTAGFLSITNSGNQACQILSAESPLSDRLEFHEHLHSDGMMRMRPVSGGLLIEAGDTLVFQPGGLHIMLFNIQHPLVTGENTPLLLNTDQCGSLQVNAEIRSLVAKPMGGMHH
ncbi:copper chaperone PCu(A)C [bacterium]|nr:copper chaperone PCu(A)C [bacterium]